MWRRLLRQLGQALWSVFGIKKRPMVLRRRHIAGLSRVAQIAGKRHAQAALTAPVRSRSGDSRLRC